MQKYNLFGKLGWSTSIWESYTISVHSIGPQILIEEEKRHAKNTLKVNIHQIIPKPIWDRDQVCSTQSFVDENGQPLWHRQLLKSSRAQISTTSYNYPEQRKKDPQEKTPLSDQFVACSKL